MGGRNLVLAGWTRMLGLSATALVVVACSSAPEPVVLPTRSPAASQPAASQPAGASVAPGSSDVPSAPAPTDPPSQPVPTDAQPTGAPASSGPGDSGGPAASLAPDVTSMTIKRTADCASNNGTGTVGMIRISWTAEGSDGVRISIDPPSPDVAYGYGFADYAATGSVDLPFACDPPTTDAKGAYHLYVVTTLHTKGYYAWRFAKVYQTP
jgi:hypothetical protein